MNDDFIVIFNNAEIVEIAYPILNKFYHIPPELEYVKEEINNLGPHYFRFRNKQWHGWDEILHLTHKHKNLATYTINNLDDFYSFCMAENIGYTCNPKDNFIYGYFGMIELD